MSKLNLSVIAGLLMSATATQAVTLDVLFSGTIATSEVDVNGTRNGIDVSDATISEGDPFFGSFSVEIDAVPELETSTFQGRVPSDVNIQTSFDLPVRDFSITFADQEFLIPDTGLTAVYTTRVSDGAVNGRSVVVGIASDNAFQLDTYWQASDLSLFSGLDPNNLDAESLVDVTMAAVDAGERLEEILVFLDESVFGLPENVCRFDTCLVYGIMNATSVSFSTDETIDVVDPVVDPTPSPVPLPASAWLLLAGLGGLGVNARRKRAL